MDVTAIIAGSASLIAGAIKYFLNHRTAATTGTNTVEIKIGNESLRVDGTLSKEDLSQLVETFQDRIKKKEPVGVTPNGR